MEKQTTLAILAIVVTIVTIPQQAEARGCESGHPNSAFGFNSRKGRCSVTDQI
jgi:hypothetical protein